MKYRYSVQFSNSAFIIACENWEQVEIEVALLGAENLLCIREYH